VAGPPRMEVAEAEEVLTAAVARTAVVVTTNSALFEQRFGRGQASSLQMQSSVGWNTHLTAVCQRLEQLAEGIPRLQSCYASRATYGVPPLFWPCWSRQKCIATWILRIKLLLRATLANHFQTFSL
jgi:hypothetical protein